MEFFGGGIKKFQYIVCVGDETHTAFEWGINDECLDYCFPG